MRRWNLLIAFVLVATALTGCQASPESEHPAVAVVRSVLELRTDSNSNADEYRPYFADADVADQLAADSGSGESPIPPWTDVYVSAESTESVDVVVIWDVTEDFDDWPTGTVFMVTEAADGWVITDASEVATDVPEPLDTVDE
jgi:hypothetical protein